MFSWRCASWCAKTTTMDLYEDSFKLQEMIASDMQSSLGECILSTSQQMGSGSASAEHGSVSAGSSDGVGGGPGDLHGQGATLTDLAPAVPVDPLDGPMDEDEQSWMNENTSQLFANMDFENIDQGLLVNPQTGLPVNFPQGPAASPVITSSCTLDDSALGLTDAEIKMPSPQEHQSFPFFVIQQSEQLGQTDEAMVASPTLKAVKGEPKVKKEKARKSTVSGATLPSGDDGKSYPKPAYSYSCLIAMALKNSQSGSLPVNEIYNFMIEHFPYFKTAPNGWKNSVRHNLSLNKCFEKIEKPVTKGAPRKGCLWAMNPDKVSKMNEELHKWNARDPMAIRRSMANPERLEQLSKGELKREYDEDDYCQQPVVSTTEEDLVSLSPDQTTSLTSGQTDVIQQDASPSSHGGGDSLPSLESNIQLDDLDLQYEACMELLGDSLSNSNTSSQLGTLIGGQLSENNNNSQSQAVSFVQCNYIYSTADSESNVTSSLALGAAQEPLITSTANVR